MLAYGLLFASKCDGIQLKEENVSVDSIMGHGGLFKTPVVGQRILAAALNAPVTVMETAGEGGPWGMAVLAAYMLEHGMGRKALQIIWIIAFSQVRGVLPLIR